MGITWCTKLRMSKALGFTEEASPSSLQEALGFLSAPSVTAEALMVGRQSSQELKCWLETSGVTAQKAHGDSLRGQAYSYLQAPGPSSRERSGTWVQLSPPPCPRGGCTVPAFLATLYRGEEGPQDLQDPVRKSFLRDTGENPCRLDWSVWASGPDLFQQTSRIDSQDCSGRAKLVTANSGEGSAPTAGTQGGFCYTRAQPVTVFAITLAFTPEHHPAVPCFSAKGEGKG